MFWPRPFAFRFHAGHVHARRLHPSFWPVLLDRRIWFGLARVIDGARRYTPESYRPRPGYGLIRLESRHAFLELVWWLYVPVIVWRRRWLPVELLLDLGLVECAELEHYRQARPIGWSALTRWWREVGSPRLEAAFEELLT